MACFLQSYLVNHIAIFFRSVMNSGFIKIVFLLVLQLLCLRSSLLAEPLTHDFNKHNLSNRAIYNGVIAGDPDAGGTTRICVFCHTPHSATPETTLWNRPEPKQVNFPLYGENLVIAGTESGSPPTSQTDSQYGLGVYPNGASRMCMSCHDGVTAIGLLRDNSTVVMLDLLGGTLDGDGSLNDTIGATINLETAHPISFIYDETVVGNIESVRGVGTYQLPPDTSVVPLDNQNRMQCTTCHDPHNDTNLDGLGLPFWRNVSSADPYDDVCNACHVSAITNINNFTSGDPTGTHQLPFTP